MAADVTKPPHISDPKEPRRAVAPIQKIVVDVHKTDGVGERNPTEHEDDKLMFVALFRSSELAKDELLQCVSDAYDRFLVRSG